MTITITILLKQLRSRIAELEKFILSRCYCKSMPDQTQTCSYCEVVHGKKES